MASDQVQQELLEEFGARCWVFREDLDESFERFQDEQRHRADQHKHQHQHQQHRAAQAGHGSPKGSREVQCRDAEDRDAEALDVAFFARPGGRSLSMLGQSIDSHDAKLRRAALLGARKLGHKIREPKAIPVPTKAQLEQRSRERIAQLRMETMKFKPLSDASHWRVRGPVTRYTEISACYRAEAASSSIAAPPRKPRAFFGNALARVNAKLEAARTQNAAPTELEVPTEKPCTDSETPGTLDES